MRLPRESLAHGQANCIDGAVLFASLLEGISINPAIVLVPGHALVAWETWKNSGEWKYLETTMIGTGNFKDACVRGESYANNPKLTRWSLRDLRSKGIMPME